MLEGQSGREKKEGADGDQDGDDLLDQEEPLPGVEACDVVHVLEDASGEEAGYDVADGVARVPNGHPEGRLLLGVPRGGH